jgi:hypothetical protein
MIVMNNHGYVTRRFGTYLLSRAPSDFVKKEVSW